MQIKMKFLGTAQNVTGSGRFLHTSGYPANKQQLPKGRIL
jgi:hypothetical protein